MLKAHHVQIVSTVKVRGLCKERIAGGGLSSQITNIHQTNAQIND